MQDLSVSGPLWLNERRLIEMTANDTLRGQRPSASFSRKDYYIACGPAHGLLSSQYSMLRVFSTLERLPFYQVLSRISVTATVI